MLNVFKNKVKCKLILARLPKESDVRIHSDYKENAGNQFIFRDLSAIFFLTETLCIQLDTSLPR